MDELLTNEIFTDESAWQAEWQRRLTISRTRCTRCLYDNRVPKIQFDMNGVCDYCHQHDKLLQQYSGEKGEAQFSEIVKKIKKEGKKQEYDIIVGVSGGADSSYLIYLAKEWGLRPLAVHFDNTWNSTIAVENIQQVLSRLNVPLFTHVVDNQEYDDLYRAILAAGVPDLEAPTDLGLAATLNEAAHRHNIKYIFEGHSFKTEGISPLGWLYMDAKYIDSMHRAYGTLPRLKSYPYLWLWRQLKWMLLDRVKKIRPFWYIPYHKENAKQFLQQEFGWQWYGGHHLENRLTNFYHTYFMARRFNIDGRINGYSALVRSNQMTQQQGLDLINSPPACDQEIIALFKKRLKLSDTQFLAHMLQPKKTYRDFKTYKPTFEKLRPFFYLMAKLQLIPMSFYLKYTAK